MCDLENRTGKSQEIVELVKHMGMVSSFGRAFHKPAMLDSNSANNANIKF